MSDTLSAECVLANIFRKFPEVTVPELKKVARAMTSGIDIDITDDSMTGAVSDYPKLFEYQGKCIARVKRPTKNDLLNFNAWYSDAVINDLQKAIRTLSKKSKSSTRTKKDSKILTQRPLRSH